MSVRRLAPADVQPKEFAFTAENLAWAKEQMAKYPVGREMSAVIPLLWKAQEQAGGWLPQKAIEHVAGLLELPDIRVLEVATFYTMFNLAPVGKFYVQLCGTTPCMLRGAEDLKKVCREKIGEQQHVTEDGKFSWIEVECLGACVNAPMVQINYDFYEDLTPATLAKVLDDFAAGKQPKPGPQIDRQLSAPFGGPTTLTDPSLYPSPPQAKEPAAGTPKQRGAALTDEDLKKPGAAADVSESPVPKPSPPIDDSTRPTRRKRK
ncbi:MAG TPA: NADH-quinone oxidoreductase subunit NuoE [Xanthobacteraceae bacterium]|jgi:NADH-quinone oxidoreductase subunit E|nr:NADH-quinone oxidoreductase subunit NuoE [Xanthobacteraceae bacterium]